MTSSPTNRKASKKKASKKKVAKKKAASKPLASTTRKKVAKKVSKKKAATKKKAASYKARIRTAKQAIADSAKAAAAAKRAEAEVAELREEFHSLVGRDPDTGQWLPGVSGNPGGRPVELQEIKLLARKKTENALNKLEEIVNDPGEKGSARVSAAVAIMDRAYGKPAQALAGPDGESPVKGEIAFNEMTDDEATEYYFSVVKKRATT